MTPVDTRLVKEDPRPAGDETASVNLLGMTVETDR
jgi:hypothetical protein